MRTAPTPYFQTQKMPAPAGVAGIFHTLRVMRALVNESKLNAQVLQTATSIIWHATEKDEFGQALALFEYVRDFIHYVKDPVGVESVSAPVYTLARMVGDCDDQTTLLCSLFESVGFPTRFVIAGYNSKTFEHVYCQVLVQNQWVDCDPTEHQAFGWAPPSPLVYFVENSK